MAMAMPMHPYHHLDDENPACFPPPCQSRNLSPSLLLKSALFALGFCLGLLSFWSFQQPPITALLHHHQPYAQNHQYLQNHQHQQSDAGDYMHHHHHHQYQQNHPYEQNQQYEQNHHQHPNTNPSLDFLVVGDWGRLGLYNQSQVAIQMGRIGEQLDIQFVVSVGDNFYDTGLTGADDPNFTASFTNVFTAPSLQKTWYTVLGNHDYMGDAICQIDDTLVKRDSRWFCRREFELQRSLCGTASEGTCSASVDMFFIDTTPFINEYWDPNATQTFDWRGLAPRKKQLESQLQSLAYKLENSTATWKIVIGHHTIRSIGHHGDLPELLDQLLPILERYGVDMYINGHDHNLQHIKRPDSDVHFFTSGGGSKAFSGLRPYGEDAGVQFAYDGQGFLAISMMARSVSFSFYDVFGSVLYSYVLEK